MKTKAALSHQVIIIGTELLKQSRVSDDYPELNAGFERCLPGLHFVGAAAAFPLGGSVALYPAPLLLRASLLVGFWRRNGSHRNCF